MNTADLQAVVAGDIVASTELSKQKRRRLADTIDAAYTDIRDAFGTAVPHPLAISAGDEWRIYVDDPEQALAVAVGFSTRLQARELTSRMVLVADTVDFIDQGDLHRSDGPAFRRAGRRLKTMAGSDSRFTMLLPTDDESVASIWAESTGELVDILLDDLTAAQARAVTEMICETRKTGSKPTLQQIGNRWSPDSIGKQTVSQHLRRARWPAIQRTLRRYERFWKLPTHR